MLLRLNLKLLTSLLAAVTGAAAMAAEVATMVPSAEFGVAKSRETMGEEGRPVGVDDGMDAR